MIPPPDRILDHTPSRIAAALRSGGLHLDHGACRVRVRSTVPGFAEALHRAYRAFSFQPATDFVDIHVQLLHGHAHRRWLRPTVRFRIDGVEPFDPFPRAGAMALFEWGVNWSFGKRFNQYVLLHAAVLAREDRAVLLPAVPGFGKSTLAAALMLSAFRLLSDEFGVLDPAGGTLLPMIKPIALKNRSIRVIGDFSADARIGPTITGTRKGDVAHLAPDEASAAAAHAPARPSVIVFPAYREGAALQLKAQPPELAFARLAFNSFNYALLGPVSFDAVARIAATCPAYEMSYGHLPDAVRCLGDLIGDRQ